MNRLRRAVVAAAVATAVLGLAGCGVPLQAKPVAIKPDAALAEAVSPTTPAAAGASKVDLYFVDGERLERVERPITQLPTDTVAVDQLLKGVTADEKADGLLSAIPPGTTALAVGVEHGIMTLNLSEQFKPTGNTYLQACAQIVYTVTSIPGINSVRFLVGGDQVIPPTVDSGNLAVVDRQNYRTLAP